MSFLKELNIVNVNEGASIGDGQWMHDSSAKIFESISPTNGELIAKVRACTKDQYSSVVENASKVFKTWRNVPAPQRGELVRIIGEKLRKYKDPLGSLVAYEMGKSKAEGDGEVQEMIDMADFAVGQSRMLYGLSMHSERFEHRMLEQWHPLGVIGVISAFNFPVAVWSWNAFISAICGNTVIWKPSEKTPLTAVAVQNICHEASKELNIFGVFSLVVTNDISIAQDFVANKNIPLVSFTGSCETGFKVHEKVAKRGGRSLLELGGNNAIIVDDTADLKIAIPAIVFGAVGTAGQRCTSTRRVFVHERNFNEVEDLLKQAYEQITIGDPLDTNNMMGPLIDENAVNDYEDAIKTAKSQGAKIIFGGKKIDLAGYYVEPTIIKAKNEWPIVQKETFAPILYLIEYTDFDQALEMQNDVEQGLSSSLFTNNLLRSEQFLSARGSDCGIANINIGTSGAEIGGAFGGEKATGGGREAGSDAWKAYMRRQTCTINWGSELPLAQGIKFDIPLK
jgi:aldehyde dehydrogenase (NAD+)